MTAIITQQSIDSLLDSTNTLTQLSVPPLENLAKSIIDTLPVLKPSTLLIKRHSSSNLDDLIVKKIKTQSTNCSDSESIFHANLSSRRTDSKTFPSLSRSGSIESVEKDDGFILEEDFSTEGLTLIDQASKGLFYVPPLENALPFDSFKKNEGFIPALELNGNTFDALQQSLEALKNQLMINQFKDLLIQTIFPVNHGENTLKIPPFIEQNETQIRVPFEEKISKRLPKKIEEEMAITYGEIEFPFLSIAADNNNITGALLQVNQNVLSDKSNDEMPKKRKYTKLNSVFKILKHSQENERKEDKAAKKDKKALKVEKAMKKVVMLEETKEKKLQTKKPSPVKSIINIGQNVQNQKINKKSIKEEAKSPMEIEETSQGTRERESFLSFPFVKRRGEERKKNRWQVSQDIKLGDLQIPVLNIANNFAIMFEGNKKKSSQIAVGSEYQVDIDFCITKSKGSNKRQPKLRWDPSAQKESDINRLFKDVENITEAEADEEKIIKYLAKNKGDIKKTKKYIKDNKSKISQDLIIKALE